MNIIERMEKNCNMSLNVSLYNKFNCLTMRAKCIILLIQLSLLSLISCVRSRTVVNNTVDLDTYKYASISETLNYSGSLPLGEIESEILEAVESVGFEMVGDQRINEFTPEEKSKLLMVRISTNQESEQSIVNVNFVDYMTGKPMASCRGVSGVGLYKKKELMNAVT